MAKRDPETGIEAKATDGEPDESVTPLRRRGRDIDQEPAAVEYEDDLELFPLGSVVGDAKVDWRRLAPAGKPVKLECNLSRAAVPMEQGLYRFGAQTEVLVTCEAGVVKQVPTFEDNPTGGERICTAITLRQEMRAIHVRSADDLWSTEQVLDVLEQHFGIPRSADKVAEIFGLRDVA